MTTTPILGPGATGEACRPVIPRLRDAGYAAQGTVRSSEGFFHSNGRGVYTIIVEYSWLARGFTEGDVAGAIDESVFTLPISAVSEPLADVGDTAVAAPTESRHTRMTNRFIRPRHLTLANAAALAPYATENDISFVRIHVVVAHAADRS